MRALSPCSSRHRRRGERGAKEGQVTVSRMSFSQAKFQFSQQQQQQQLLSRTRESQQAPSTKHQAPRGKPAPIASEPHGATSGHKSREPGYLLPSSHQLTINSQSLPVTVKSINTPSTISISSTNLPNKPRKYHTPSSIFPRHIQQTPPLFSCANFLPKPLLVRPHRRSLAQSIPLPQIPPPSLFTAPTTSGCNLASRTCPVLASWALHLRLRPCEVGTTSPKRKASRQCNNQS